MDKPTSKRFDLAAALFAAYPELPQIAEAAGKTPLFVVGGALRDLLVGRGRSDLDLAVDGDLLPIIRRLGGELPVSHDRFQTASVTVDGLRVDLARTRKETYSSPGALPDVAPAPIEQDLARRDITIYAMAMRIEGPEPSPAWELLDPFGGRRDLANGTLRFLHARSIRDDPTRALRAARYAAGYGLQPDAEAARQLAEADLGTVSWQRRRADLLRIASDPHALEALDLLERWGVARLRHGWRRRAESVMRLLSTPPWQGSVPRDEALLAAVWPEAAPQGGRTDPPPAPSTDAAIVASAKKRRPLELLLLRADGAQWLDDYMSRLRHIRLEIDGQDLLDAGIPEGPAIGVGLTSALERKLNGEIAGREDELAAALAAAAACAET